MRSRPRFVILHHVLPPDHPQPDHWDLMLEEDGVLRTWAMPLEPRNGLTTTAEQLADHRLEYLDYEGPVSGNRGQVSQWDAGHYEPLLESDDHWSIECYGRRLRGCIRLDRQSVHNRRWDVTFAVA